MQTSLFRAGHENRLNFENVAVFDELFRKRLGRRDGLAGRGINQRNFRFFV